MKLFSKFSVLLFGFASCQHETSSAEPTMYTVTVSSSIEHGKVTVDKTSAEAGTTITLTATADDGYELDSYSVTDSSANAITVTNGTFTMPESNVTVSAAFKVVIYIGTKAPNVAKEVGDIVFNDGSAMPYVNFTALTDEEKNAKKTSAIALIFYKGTGLNSDAANGTPDTTTSRTLGVGLKHNRSGLAWCRRTDDSDYANAYDKNITTIQCPASGNAGALTFTGDKNGSDNLEQIEAFEGVDDTSTEGNYPAFYFAKNYSTTATNLGTNYASGWYLPSIAELFQIYANGKGTNKAFDIDAAIETLGGDKFSTSYYWSSSQYAAATARFAADQLSFSNGAWNGRTKHINEQYVCAIRAFN